MISSHYKTDAVWATKQPSSSFQQELKERGDRGRWKLSCRGQKWSIATQVNHSHLTVTATTAPSSCADDVLTYSHSTLVASPGELLV